jgi:hypothetical protein
MTGVVGGKLIYKDDWGTLRESTLLGVKTWRSRRYMSRLTRKTQLCAFRDAEYLTRIANGTVCNSSEDHVF